ncbi:MAG: hypothetical protein ACOVOE_10105, partial [Caulobacter sp.]
DPQRVDQAALKTAGARGFVRVGEHAAHVVLGPEAERIGQAVRAMV